MQTARRLPGKTTVTVSFWIVRLTNFGNLPNSASNIHEVNARRRKHRQQNTKLQIGFGLVVNRMWVGHADDNGFDGQQSTGLQGITRRARARVKINSPIRTQPVIKGPTVIDEIGSRKKPMMACLYRWAKAPKNCARTPVALILPLPSPVLLWMGAGITSVIAKVMMVNEASVARSHSAPAKFTEMIPSTSRFCLRVLRSAHTMRRQ